MGKSSSVDISNWGNFPKVSSPEKAFSTLEQYHPLIGSEKSMIARGLGRCYGDASLSSVAMLSMVKFDKILSFDEQTGILEAQSGISFDKILDFIIPRGWFLPVSPGTRFITLGGAVASDIHGKNHHAEGSFSAHVLEIDLATGDGNLYQCSQRQHAELFEATCGGMGLTGIILRVRLQLKKIDTSYIRQIQIKAKDLDHVMALFEEFKSSTYSMAWIDCLKGGKGFGRSILMTGEHAGSDQLGPRQALSPLEVGKKATLSIPFSFPSFLLNPWTVRCFNFGYYHKNIQQTIKNIIPYQPFFYPLDSILHWNRLYGRPGFVQYQLVLPLSQSNKGLKDILSRIQKKGFGSFLAVLKLFGPQSGLLSFPMEGYTLALDFPIRPGLFDFLDELDHMVLAYGGRLYLTKDARMKASMFQESYSGFATFQAIIHKYDPNQYFRSLQSERLGLHTPLYKSSMAN